MKTSIVAKRSVGVATGIEIGLSVVRNSAATPIAAMVHATAVWRGVEPNELKP